MENTFLNTESNRLLLANRQAYDGMYKHAVSDAYKMYHSAAHLSDKVFQQVTEAGKAKAMLVKNNVDITKTTPEPEAKPITNTAYVIPNVTAESDIKNRYETPLNAGVGTSGSGGAVGVPTLSGNGVAQQCWNFFTKTWGISKNWAAALVGNIEQESRFDPTVVNKSGHHGLCQWDTDDGNRWGKLVSMYPTNYETVEAQLAYIQYEITQDAYYSDVYSAIQQGDSYSIEQASKVILDIYEGAPGQELAERIQFALNAYATFVNT